MMLYFSWNKCDNKWHNDITKNQSERHKICRTQFALAQFLIWRLLWSWQTWRREFIGIGAARVDEEELAEAVRTYPMLYDYNKSIKEFKDQ